MSQSSNIEWTDATWNPVRGCTKISPGCAHCYAETFAERFRGVKGHPYEVGFNLRMVPDKLAEPLTWKKSRRVFVNSMSDLFQDGVPDEFIDRVFATMALAPQHTFQVLTKRAERMRAYVESRQPPNVAVHIHAILTNVESDAATPETPWPLPNVWLGVSVENQHFADMRIPLLLQTPAAVRFISAEPLLDAIDLSTFLPVDTIGGVELEHWLDWVIVGGESGPGARPFNVEWARSIVEQCKAGGVPVFVKQLGAHPYRQFSVNGGTFTDPMLDPRLRSRKGGDPSEWPEDLRVRPVSRSEDLMRFFDDDNIGAYLDDIGHRAEKTKDGKELKLVDLTLRVQPFTAELAGSLDPDVRALLFSLSDATPKAKLKEVRFRLTVPKQQLLIRLLPELAEQIVLCDCEITDVRARTEKGIDGYGLVFYVTYGPASPHELEYVCDWLTQQRFVTFQPQQPALDFAAREPDEETKAPRRRGRPRAVDAGDELRPGVHAEH